MARTSGRTARPTAEACCSAPARRSTCRAAPSSSGAGSGILLVELDGPRTRTVSIVVVGQRGPRVRDAGRGELALLARRARRWACFGGPDAAPSRSGSAPPRGDRRRAVGAFAVHAPRGLDAQPPGRPPLAALTAARRPLPGATRPCCKRSTRWPWPLASCGLLASGDREARVAPRPYAHRVVRTAVLVALRGPRPRSRSMPWSDVRSGRFVARSSSGSCAACCWRRPLVLVFAALLANADADLRDAPRATCSRSTCGELVGHVIGAAAAVAGSPRASCAPGSEPQGRRAARPASLARARAASRSGRARPASTCCSRGFVWVQLRYLFGGARLGGQRRRAHVLAVRAPRLLRARRPSPRSRCRCCWPRTGCSPRAPRGAPRGAGARRASRSRCCWSCSPRRWSGCASTGAQYGQTELRFYTTAFMLWLGVLLVLVPADGAARPPRRLRAPRPCVRVRGRSCPPRRQSRRAHRAREPRGAVRLRRRVRAPLWRTRSLRSSRPRTSSTPRRATSCCGACGNAGGTARATGGRGTFRAPGPFTQSDRSHERSLHGATRASLAARADHGSGPESVAEGRPSGLDRIRRRRAGEGLVPAVLRVLRALDDQGSERHARRREPGVRRRSHPRAGWDFPAGADQVEDRHERDQRGRDRDCSARAADSSSSSRPPGRSRPRGRAADRARVQSGGQEPSVPRRRGPRARPQTACETCGASAEGVAGAPRLPPGPRSARPRDRATPGGPGRP